MAYLLRNEEVVAKVVRATYYPALGAGEAICEGFSVSSGVGHADRTPGTIFITQAQLFFRSKDSENVLVALPHGALERVRKVQGKEKTGQEYVVDLICKDLRVVRLGFPVRFCDGSWGWRSSTDGVCRARCSTSRRSRP